MKHVILSVCAGALLIPFAMPAQAQSQYGMAGVQCSQYTKAARGSDMLYHQASQWLLGYVSGMNAAMKVCEGDDPARQPHQRSGFEVRGRLLRGQSGQQSRERGERVVRLAAEADRSAGRAKRPAGQQPDAQP